MIDQDIVLMSDNSFEVMNVSRWGWGEVSKSLMSVDIGQNDRPGHSPDVRQV